MTERLPLAVLLVGWGAWAIFVATFVFQRRPVAPPDRKRAPASIAGLVLQCLAYLPVWIWGRPFGTFPYQFSPAAAIIWAALTIALAVVSVWFLVSAVRTLGKEWSLTARVVEGHRLVRTGPYGWVRHPIYTGMLGMLLVSGSAWGQLPVVAVSLLIFLVGTFIRVRSEERLLREVFGAEYDEYAGRVSAIVPFVL